MPNVIFRSGDELGFSPKVIFDTNAYRNFSEQYLRQDENFTFVIDKLKQCEKDHGIIPSSSILAVMELYQHLDSQDAAYNRCKKAILFSFFRSAQNGKFNHQPLSEIEIADRLFNTYSDADMQLNGYFIDGHIKCCKENLEMNDDMKTLVANIRLQLNRYKETSFNSIIDNLEKLFTSFNKNTFKFSEQDYVKYKEKFGSDKIRMYVELGFSLFESFKKRLGIRKYSGDKDSKISDLIYDYRPALLSYIKMWENFANNKPGSKHPFKPNKNDLIDSFILFSIVPDDNIILVTDEKRIHSIFKEIGRPKSVLKLEQYLKEINFI